MNDSTGKLDFKVSPHSGLTRAHWKAHGLELIGQMFAHIPDMNSPLLFPKIPGKSYPDPNDGPDRTRAAELEGLVRSLNLVAPLLQENPGMEVRGMRLLDYYTRELQAFVLPDSPRRIPLLGTSDHPPLQQTCELGGLSAILLLYPLLWESLPISGQKALVEVLSDYAHGRTYAHNWRYFNVMIMLFLKQHDHPVDEALWQTHTDALLALDAGEGWFRDAHFDYYNSWVFHLYAPIWCRFYGYQHAPDIAALMERQSHELMQTYPLMFARDGQMIMWGRSIAYRNGAISSIPACYLFRNPPPLDPGWARRICSGNLLQFLNRRNFLQNGVPSLGFYGHFEPCIQGYSCAASPMWGYLNYLSAFSLPETHPFWTAAENEGSWTELAENVRDIPLHNPGLCITNYGHIGHVELRNGKAEPDDPNYNRLGYHSAFPWEALDPEHGMAMHYTRKTDHAVMGTGHQMPVKMYWCGYQNKVLYRQAKMNSLALGTAVAMDLADISLSNGVLRVDRPRLYFSGTLHLCHYGLPHADGPAKIEHRTVNGCAAIIARIPDRQIALVAVSGWDRVEAVSHTGFNAEAETSTLLFAEWTHADRFPPLLPKITLLLHKCDDSAWTDDELMPLQSWESPRVSELGIYGARLLLKDGGNISVSFDRFEGRKQD